MRKKIVAGNWKMNENLQEGVALAKEINEALVADKPNCDVVICTPFIHLASVANVLDSSIVGLGAENCADKASGAYTGEVSAAMVKSTGAQYVILGHSERREYYGETAEILKEKVQLALANGLKIIFCCGETLEEREAEKQNEIVKAELAGSVFHLSAEEWKNIILAYEPIWAIGTGKTATAEQAEEMCAYIRQIVAENYNQEVADETSVLYGGSCKASNAPELTNLFGLLVLVRQLPLNKQKKCVLTSVRLLQKTITKKLLTKHQYFMVVAARLAMLQNYSLSQTLMVV